MAEPLLDLVAESDIRQRAANLIRKYRAEPDKLKPVRIPRDYAEWATGELGLPEEPPDWLVGIAECVVQHG